MFEDMVAELSECRCPKCGNKGEFFFDQTNIAFRCLKCQAVGIDPFELGPWDERDPVMDTFEEKEISLYHVETVEKPPKLKLDKKKAEFIKYLHEREKQEEEDEGEESEDDSNKLQSSLAGGTAKLAE